MQVNPASRQEFLSQVNSTISDRQVTPQEMESLKKTLAESPLSAEDKQAVGQLLDKLGEFTQKEGDYYLSEPELKSIQTMAERLNSPAASRFSEEIASRNTPAASDSPATPGVSSAESTGKAGKSRNFFQVIWDALKSVFNWIAGLFGGGDKNDTKSHAQAGFDPASTTLGPGNNPPPLSDDYYSDYARPQVSESNPDFDSYLGDTAATEGSTLPPTTAMGSGRMYQRSPYHDATKFVPRFPMAAFHESGVYRKANDPYAVGAISRPRKSDDLGGKTYGTYQFESSVYTDGSSRDNRGGAGSTLSRFMNDPENPFGSQLKAAATQYGLASPQFDALWAQLSNQNNKEFGQAQEAFALKDKGQNIQNFMDKAQLSPEVRSDPRIQDLIMGTTNHVGNLADSAAEHIATLQRQLGRPMTANEVGKAIAEFKESRISSWFRSSPGAQAGIAQRFQDEATAFA